jgi:putative transcriptional regulator
MIQIRVKELLKKQKKSKYWFVKNMEGGYQSLSHLMDNETTAIHFDTLEKICDILECEPGDIIVRRKTKRRVKKSEQTIKAV